ncbi:MAG: type II secretion system F family protein [Gammaproteobacteria bacterium]
MQIDTERLFYANIALLVILPPIIWLLADNIVIGLLTFVALLFIPRMAYNQLRKRRLTMIERQLPDAYIAIANAMRSGASFAIAVQTVADDFMPPISQEIGLFLREQRLGVDLDTSLANVEKRIPIPEMTMFTSAVRISRDIGGNLAETLEKLADTLRRKQDMDGKIKSLTAQGKMQGMVMSFLPVFLVLILLKLQPEAMSKLFTTRIGWAVLGVAITMELLGYLAIRKITRIDI